MPDFKYLDATDLPSDPNGSLGQLRTSVRMAYNTSRESHDKLRLLSDTLATVLGYIEGGFEATAEIDKTVAMKNQEVIDAETPEEVETPPAKPKRAAKRPSRKPTTKD